MSTDLTGNTRTMAWVRIDDRFANHPKAIAAGPEGVALWLEGLCYTNAYLTNGHLPVEVVRRFRLVKKPLPTAGRLVTVGLWEAEDTGYLIHDYRQYYPNAAEVKARREVEAARKRRERLTSESTPPGVRPDAIARALTRVGEGTGTGTGDQDVPEEVRTSQGRDADHAADTWALWSEVAAGHGALLRLTPSPRDLHVCVELARAYAPDALRALLVCWWASPHVTSRNLHLFRAQADEVAAHVRSGSTLAFRAPLERAVAEPANPDADFWRQVDAHSRKKGAP